MIANSTYTSERIRRYYQRDAEVIAPPIDTRRFEPLVGDTVEDAPFLLVSALVPNKRVDLALRAFAGRRERLEIVGEGPERARLEQLAGPNVTFRGWVSDEALDGLYSGCRALLHPGVEDFGMAMVEALAAGKPVIASAEGGAPDIVRSGDDGLLFEEPTVESLRASLDRFALMRAIFEPARLRARARRFDRAVFERRFMEVVEAAWRSRAGAPAPRRRVEGRS
jgi:glycosyltransferase involved in cell wall biosynthesis